MKRNRIQKILILSAFSALLLASACGKQSEPVEAFSPVQQLDDPYAIATPNPTPTPGESAPESPTPTPKPTVTVQHAGEEYGEPQFTPKPVIEVVNDEGGPVITKQPTEEIIAEGENAFFIADADDYDYMSWRVYNPERTDSFSPVALPGMFGQGLYYYGDTSNQLALCCVPSDLSGWYVQAFFTKDGKTTATDRVVLNVVMPLYRPLSVSPSSGVFTSDFLIKFNGPRDALIEYTFYQGDEESGVVLASGYCFSGDRLTIGDVPGKECVSFNFPNIGPDSYVDVGPVTLVAKAKFIPGEECRAVYNVSQIKNDNG